ncbi:PD-(D/E)XK nuclease family protein [Mariniradius sediminis]|uniref:PD-(D/E)XK nuclease family protein n=1 Tax=Mariniradius sediminis TaxID=2909237 RepID=A0ABS9BUM1_9BACT|nr:PD-(D/E)XK nuclease family protein [Mariniradius sediminis]MCF1751424.1 PD-(D/E)XK nuclease family protein [Mariniradius sediminis]
MESFLKETASVILRDYKDLHNLVLVLPNRRAGLFFTQHLGQLIDKPTWMPQVKTIEDLFFQLAGQRPADDLTLIFELYRVYQQIHPQPEAFDRFYFWGEMILKDFNDLDQFMVDAGKLYHQLSELKELESDLGYLTPAQIELIRQFWRSFERQDRKHQEKFLKFWQLLGPLYQSFQSALELSGLTYSGRIYRQVAEGLEKLERPDKHFVFIGFNAFTRTEEKLVKHFVSSFGARIFWDVDQYYVEDERQEAGLFFRDYRNDRILGPTFPKELPKFIGGRKHMVKVYATPLKTSQANVVGAILEQLGPEENWEQTVVILPDEGLLFPLLHALPPQVQKVNVTMGYPVKNSPVYAFLESVLELQRYIRLVEGEVFFYHNPLRNLLAAPYLKEQNQVFVEDLFQQMVEQNLIYIPQRVLHEGGSFFRLLFQQVASKDLFSYLSQVIQSLAEGMKGDSLQRSYLYQSYRQLNRLKEIFEGQGALDLDRELFIRLFRQVFQEVKLPFEGEPLEGLQVMGVLESRNLDFKRLIICNMNEGSFPPSGGINSMIPFNLRRAFGLPVQEQNDAIYAYTIYRLLHRAEEVHMLYCTNAEQGKAGEKSRYILQMETEMQADIQEQTVFIPVGVKKADAILIDKSPGIMTSLEEFLVGSDFKSMRAFSPSVLNAYLDCRLKFYFQEIAKIQEKEEISEEVDASVFGNIAHYSMEFLYGGFIERKKRDTLEPGDFEDLKKYWVFPAVEKGIRKFYRLDEHADTKLSGQLAIVRDVMQKYLERILDLDEVDAPFTLLTMEKKYQASVALEDGRHIALKGFIDRVDRKGEVIRLIDYKSGRDEKSFSGIESLFDRGEEKRNKAAFQTLFYGLLYQTTHPENTFPLKPALFNFRQIFEENFNPYLQLKIGRAQYEEVQDYSGFSQAYEIGLRETLEELFDPSVPFSQTEIVKKCEYCPYKVICGR